MSFFFTQRQSKKFTDINVLHQLECKICPLYNLVSNKNKDIKPTGSEKPLIYILGSGTNENEDKRGEFYSDSPGRFLKSNLSEFQVRQARFNQITRTHDPKNSSSFEAIECCRPSVERDIAATKPKAIFGFGQEALQWALKNKGTNLEAWRGKHFPINILGHVCWFFSMYDPEYVQKHIFLSHVFKLDITNAYKFLNRKIEAQVENKKLVHENTELLFSIPAIRKALFEILANKPFSYIDLETNTDRPFYTGSKILSIAVGCPEYSIAFPLLHSQAKWTPEELIELKQLFYEFLCLPQIKYAHNTAFELEWLAEEYGPQFMQYAVWKDSMAAGYVLGYGGKSVDKENGEEGVLRGLLSLDNMCQMYFGFFLKNLSPLTKDNLASEPLQNILLYNVLDVKYGAKLVIKTEADIKYEKLDNIFIEQCRRIPTMVLTQRKGLPYDKNLAQTYWDNFSNKATKSTEDCLNHPQILEYKTKFGKFDLNSAKDMALFFKYLGYEEVFVPDEKDKNKTKLSSDEEVLKKIVENHKHPVAGNLLIIREVNKIKDTYLKPFVTKSVVFPDGRLHTQFTTMFTTTGRISSKDPNIQNFPKRKNKDIRRIIIPPPGFVFNSNDFGQIEARVLAMASKDPKFVEALWTGFDIHADWALRLAKKYPKRVGGNAIVYKWESTDIQTLKDNDKLFKAFRDIVKNKWVFPSFFGASTKSLSGYMDIPVEICKKAHEEFWDEFQVIRAWQEEMYTFYKKFGYVESLTGRRRYAYMQGGEIINHPIQSCLQRGSRVFTDKGLIPIETLVGKTTNVWTGFKWAEAIGIKAAKSKLIKITTNTGLTINCDDNHKLKNSNKDWIEVTNLKIGDSIALPTVSNIELKWSGNYNWPYMLGVYIGDGSFYQSGKNSYPRFSLAGSENDFEERQKLATAFRNMGYSFRWERKSGGFTKSGKPYVDRINLCFDGHKFANKLIELGLSYGKNAHSKRIPNSVWLMSRQDQRDFLEGFYQSDGSKVKYQNNNIHLCQKEILQELQILSSAVGVDTYLTQTANGWKLSARKNKLSRRRYNKNILIKDFLNKKIDLFPRIKYGTLTKENKIETISEKKAIKNNQLTQPIAERLYKKYLINTEIYRFDTIINIEFIQLYDDTFTMSVKDDLHQFVADGVIHKNTACDIVLDAMNRLSEYALSTGKEQFQACMNIHDDLGFFLSQETWKEDTAFIIREMLACKFDFINVPLTVESSIGSNWYDGKEIGTFASNKLNCINIKDFEN